MYGVGVEELGELVTDRGSGDGAVVADGDIDIGVLLQPASAAFASPRAAMPPSRPRAPLARISIAG